MPGDPLSRPLIEIARDLREGRTRARDLIEAAIGRHELIALGRRLCRSTVTAFDASPRTGNACARLPQREQ
jgi:hypothetical protein